MSRSPCVQWSKQTHTITFWYTQIPLDILDKDTVFCCVSRRPCVHWSYQTYTITFLYSGYTYSILLCVQKSICPVISTDIHDNLLIFSIQIQYFVVCPEFHVSRDLNRQKQLLFNILDKDIVICCVSRSQCVQWSKQTYKITFWYTG